MKSAPAGNLFPPVANLQPARPALGRRRASPTATGASEPGAVQQLVVEGRRRVWWLLQQVVVLHPRGEAVPLVGVLPAEGLVLGREEERQRHVHGGPLELRVEVRVRLEQPVYGFVRVPAQ